MNLILRLILWEQPGSGEHHTPFALSSLITSALKHYSDLERLKLTHWDMTPLGGGSHSENPRIQHVYNLTMPN